MIHNHLPTYEASYELDGLDILALHVTGHGHDLDTLELVLADAWYEELIDSGCWEITNPPGCCDRWRGKPTSASASTSTRRSSGLSGSKPFSRSRASVLREVPQAGLW